MKTEPLSPQLSFPYSQRWNRGQPRYRPSRETIDPSRYAVDVLPERLGREFVERHHYAHSWPATRLACGLFEVTGGASTLCGVAAFSVPMNNSVIPCYTGLVPAAGVELGRFVLLDQVPGNAETFFLGKAFRVLRSVLPDVKAVLSYSDPVARIQSNGQILKPGHIGVVYISHNARFFGRSSARNLILARDGRVVSERTLSKLRTGERGADGAYRQLLSMGAPNRLPHEPIERYLQRALRDGGFSRHRHPGNFAYGWAIGGPRERASLMDGFRPGLPRPTEADAPLHLAA